MNDLSPSIAEPPQLHAPDLQGRSGHRTTASEGLGVWLHTGWRSGGTWVWSRCRDSADVDGYYEPLHEKVANLRRRDIAALRPGSWHSNHSATSPYFEEYRKLIRKVGRGVALYQERFAFEQFFRDPDAPPDPELEAYLNVLISNSSAADRLPVLKFCRSLGRVGWLERRFPLALHAVVLRDPTTQFQSAQRLLTEQRNRYFALAPLLVLAKNAMHPFVRQSAYMLGVTIPPLFSNDMPYGVETCWRLVRRQGLAERYRTFLAFWTLCAVSALDSSALVIDMDAMQADPRHRLDIECVLRTRIGSSLTLTPRASAIGQHDFPPGATEAHHAATALAISVGARLAPARLDIILAKLATPAGLADASSRFSHLTPSWRQVAMPPLPADRTSLQRMATGAMVLTARAVQPLRRLHGRIARRP